MVKSSNVAFLVTEEECAFRDGFTQSTITFLGVSATEVQYIFGSGALEKVKRTFYVENNRCNIITSPKDVIRYCFALTRSQLTNQSPTNILLYSIIS